MAVRVLVDAIHADLYQSLRLLFEHRFGWEVYRPYGLDWYTSGIWNFERSRLGDQVERQFLEPWGDDALGVGCWVRADVTHPGEAYRGVTLEQARELRPHLVISTLAENDAGLHAFASEVGAHFGVQLGNQGQPSRWDLAEFALLSTTTPELPGGRPWMPHVFYRQEFSLEQFHADGGRLAEPDLVATRVQCFTGTPDYAMFRQLAGELPQLRFRWYGHCGEADELYGGNAMSTPQVAEQMHLARAAYHAKRWSDGYGHVIHGWAAIGRPLLVTADYYRGKLAEPLLEGSWNLEAHTVHETVKHLERLYEDDEAWRLECLRVAQRFRDVVDFEAEAAAIRAMLEGVL